MLDDDLNISEDTSVRPLDSEESASEESLRDADLEASVLDTLVDTVLTGEIHHDKAWLYSDFMAHLCSYVFV